LRFKEKLCCTRERLTLRKPREATVRRRPRTVCQNALDSEGWQVDKAGYIAETIDRERSAATDGLLPCGNLALQLTTMDNLHAMPVTEEEIAAVEAFLGLHAATILANDKSNRSKAL